MALDKRAWADLSDYTSLQGTESARHPSIFQSIHPSDHPFIHSSIHLYILSFFLLFIYPSNQSSFILLSIIHPSFHSLFIYLPFYLSVHPSFHSSIYPPPHHPSICPSNGLPNYLSFYASFVLHRSHPGGLPGSELGAGNRNMRSTRRPPSWSCWQPWGRGRGKGQCDKAPTGCWVRAAA